MAVRAPGFLWIVLVGAAGFAAGFFGPMVFLPDSNLGPIYGILYSGPAGVALGAALFVLCWLLGVSARTQWRCLQAAVSIVVLVTLVRVQPDPALRGFIYDSTVTACSAPRAAEATILASWRERIARVTWAAPRAGWEQEMRAALRDAPGALVTVQLAQQRRIYEHRKPWNRGKLFAAPWAAADGEETFYASSSACADFPSGLALRSFVRYDLNGRIEAPKDWPPRDLDRIIPGSPYSTVPSEYAAL